MNFIWKSHKFRVKFIVISHENHTDFLLSLCEFTCAIFSCVRFICITFQSPFYLLTAVDQFKEEYISPNVLKRLIKQNVYEEVITNEKKEVQIYQENVPCDFFILLLEGTIWRFGRKSIYITVIFFSIVAFQILLLLGFHA